MNAADTWEDDAELTKAISAAMVELYATFYAHDRTTATTYLNDNIVVCVLENILTESEDLLVASGAHDDVIDGRVAFQAGSEDAFAATIERLARRRVVAFLQREPDHSRCRVRAVLPGCGFKTAAGPARSMSR